MMVLSSKGLVREKPLQKCRGFFRVMYGVWDYAIVIGMRICPELIARTVIELASDTFA